MMKKILSILLFVAISVPAFSQLTFDTDSAYMVMESGQWKKCEIELTNSGNHDIEVSWKLINSTILDFGNPLGRWDVGYCDCIQCYFNEFAELIKLDTCPDPMAPGASIKWYITMDPGAVQIQDAEWVIEVYNHTDDIKDTLSYFLLDGPNSVSKISYNAEVSSYPNPANNEMVVNYALTNVNAPVLSVYNIVGSKVATYPLNGSNGRLNVNTADLVNGMYFYTIEEEGQRIFIQKFNVVH